MEIQSSLSCFSVRTRDPMSRIRLSFGDGEGVLIGCPFKTDDFQIAESPLMDHDDRSRKDHVSNSEASCVLNSHFVQYKGIVS
jgi:hypothetical protein